MDIDILVKDVQNLKRDFENLITGKLGPSTPGEPPKDHSTDVANLTERLNTVEQRLADMADDRDRAAQSGSEQPRPSTTTPEPQSQPAQDRFQPPQPQEQPQSGLEDLPQPHQPSDIGGPALGNQAAPQGAPHKVGGDKPAAV